MAQPHGNQRLHCISSSSMYSCHNGSYGPLKLCLPCHYVPLRGLQGLSRGTRLEYVIWSCGCQHFACIHAHMHTLTHQHTHTCMSVLSFHCLARVTWPSKKERDRNSKSRPPHSGKTCITDRGHSIVALKPEDQCESSSRMYPSIVTHALELFLS